MFVFTQPLPVSTCHVRRETISRIREHAEGSKSQRLPNNFCFWPKFVRFLDAPKGKALKLAACQEMLIGGFFLQRFLDIGESYFEPR